jgi:hypothetical protein
MLTDLDHARFKNLLFIPVRGYDTLRYLEKDILRGQLMIMCVETSQKEVAETINELCKFWAAPDVMEVDPDAKLFFKRYDIDYTVKSTNASFKAAVRFKLNLYFDPVRKGRELVELEIAVSLQGVALNELLKDQTFLDDGAAIKRDYNYFNVKRDPATMTVNSFTLKEEKVRK